MSSHGLVGARRMRVKSGCRTCKIRKVKCDEGHPACRRCVSTGRVCDGYGVWGGGGNFYGQRQLPHIPEQGLKHAPLVPRRPMNMPGLALNSREREYLDWFRCRTLTKLPGSFISGFWTSLLLQAGLQEPAVLDAILALSSIHRREPFDTRKLAMPGSPPDDQEKFALQHYVKAITHLRPRCSSKDRASLRVSLIACLIFIALELLRGHFETVLVHLRNGFGIMTEAEMLYQGDDGVFYSYPCRESADEWIIEAFSRLMFQVALVKYAYWYPCQVLQHVESMPHQISSLSQAWRQLQRLFNDIFHLTRQNYRKPGPPQVKRQQRVVAELDRWLDLYEAFRSLPGSSVSAEERKAYQLLRPYHTMASIMAATCLHPHDEMVYDSQTPQFVTLVSHIVELWAMSSTPVGVLPYAQGTLDIAHSITDIGWIPALLFVAIKCRVRRLRLHAIRFMENSFHREGFWDGYTAACVARKLMQVEEHGFYTKAEAGDFAMDSLPSPEELALPALPASRRIRDPEIILAGSPMDRILLFCKQGGAGAGCRVLLAEYCVRSRRWTDGGHTKPEELP